MSWKSCRCSPSSAYSGPYGHGGREESLSHQKNILCMTLKITSKSLKHMIMHWHVSSTWPVYDLNVVFKYRYWAFPFLLVFTYYNFCFTYDKKTDLDIYLYSWIFLLLLAKTSCTCSSLGPNNLIQSWKKRPRNMASLYFLWHILIFSWCLCMGRKRSSAQKRKISPILFSTHQSPLDKWK